GLLVHSVYLSPNLYNFFSILNPQYFLHQEYIQFFPNYYTTCNTYRFTIFQALVDRLFPLIFNLLKVFGRGSCLIFNNNIVFPFFDETKMTEDRRRLYKIANRFNYFFKYLLIALL